MKSTHSTMLGKQRNRWEVNNFLKNDSQADNNLLLNKNVKEEQIGLHNLCYDVKKNELDLHLLEDFGQDNCDIINKNVIKLRDNTSCELEPEQNDNKFDNLEKNIIEYLKTIQFNTKEKIIIIKKFVSSYRSLKEVGSKANNILKILSEKLEESLDHVKVN